MRKPAPSSVDTILLFGTYTGALSIVAVLLAVHRLGDRALLGPLRSVARLGFVGGAIAGTCAVLLLIWRLRRPGRVDRQSQILTLLMGAVTVAAILVLCEAAVRVFSVRQADSWVFLDTKLLPRRWEDITERYRAVLRKQEADLSYLAYDDRLGWSPAPNRASDNGLYFSSTEGLRSPSPGISMLGATAAPEHDAPYRVALVGDSYTFGEDVTYEETWGHQLEQLLGPGVQVRNFGVPGFGVDQAVLRYERDVRPWRPQIVILAPIQHDFMRTMTVYNFLAFPDWDYPFSKPRFAFRGHQLVLLNSPTIAPRTIFAHEQVTDLPLVGYDVGYDPDEWATRPSDLSFLVRFLASRFPPLRSPPASADSSMSDTAVNRAVLRRFVELVQADGGVPVLARLPSPSELARTQTTLKISQRLIREVGEETGVRHTDLTEALRTVDPTRLRSTKGRALHYSPEANRVVAEHFATIVADLAGTSLGRQ